MKKKDPNKKFLKFIEKFLAEEFDLNKEKKENGSTKFTIKNFLKTGIDIDNRYGFLSLNFNNRREAEAFRSFTGLDHSEHKIKEISLVRTFWSPDEYPCRVYTSGNKRRITFCESTEITDLDELFDSYVTVFQSVMLAIVMLKMSKALK